jgi:hypothetical protein
LLWGGLELLSWLADGWGMKVNSLGSKSVLAPSPKEDADAVDGGGVVI